MNMKLSQDTIKKITNTLSNRMEDDFKDNLLEHYIDNKYEEDNSFDCHIERAKDKVIENYLEDGSNIDDIIDYLPEDLEIDGKETEILESIFENDEIMSLLTTAFEKYAKDVEDDYDDSDPYDYRTYGFTMSDFI